MTLCHNERLPGRGASVTMLCPRLSLLTALLGKEGKIRRSVWRDVKLTLGKLIHGRIQPRRRKLAGFIAFLAKLTEKCHAVRLSACFELYVTQVIYL